MQLDDLSKHLLYRDSADLLVRDGICSSTMLAHATYNTFIFDSTLCDEIFKRNRQVKLKVFTLSCHIYVTYYDMFTSQIYIISTYIYKRKLTVACTILTEFLGVTKERTLMIMQSNNKINQEVQTHHDSYNYKFQTILSNIFRWFLILSGAMNVLILQCCIYILFFFVHARRCRNNTSIFNLSSFFGSKVNLVSALKRSFLEILDSFQNHRGKPKKKLRKNGNFYAKPVFDQIDFFIWFVDKKILDDKNSKFTKSVENAKISNISRKSLKILPNLNFDVFGPLKHKPPFSPTTENYILG
ncbi:Uncharacterized protein FWK35_00001055 [Aphis craccivora]|uniref:Uncharacterized protein n=1 Tax=Aphis craccivora TaxID=307492 RepID=A0A6G0ZPJ9_APHCR|nr:Uncharacterized protein FWK35_00001055 [Aphis craccivora]